jgi:dTDP-4-dehydrorhamnose reductase
MGKSKMKILVTGYSGQLGYDVVQEGLRYGLDIVGTSSKDLDITQEQNVTEFVKKLNPDAIIHCAAYTAVDKAEDEKEICWKVNVDGTKYLADAAKLANAKFMFVSTDYVFDGRGTTPYSEKDYPFPVGYYGKTKYEAEKVLQEIIEEYFIVRISWVFGINGKNFIKTMLKLAEKNETLNVVSDQYGSPTYTFDLAHLLIEMIQTEKYGIYHASNEGFCSWADFAKEIFKQAEKSVIVKGITTEEYPTRAARPKNSRMDKQKLISNGFKKLPKWEDALSRYLNEIKHEVK